MQGDDRLEPTPSGTAQPKAPPKPRRSSATKQKAGDSDSSPKLKKTRAQAKTQKEAKPAVKARPRAARSSKREAVEATVSSTNGSSNPKPHSRPRLKEKYLQEVIPAMMEEFSYSTPMEVPRLVKVVLNIGLGEALTNSRVLESATNDLTTISGQKPIVTRARKSIAGFKLREGAPIGVCVTLRGTRMHHFLDRIFNATLSRIRDFRGVSRKSFDGRGNYSFGMREQIVFPEIEYSQIERVRGLQITIATTAKNDNEGARLLELLGMPFAHQN